MKRATKLIWDNLRAILCRLSKLKKARKTRKQRCLSVANKGVIVLIKQGM